MEVRSLGPVEVASVQEAVARGRLDEAAGLLQEALRRSRSRPSPARDGRRHAAASQRHQTVTLVRTSVGSIEELRRGFPPTDGPELRRRRARRRRPAQEVRRDVVIACLLAVAASLQLAVATAFLPWRVVAEGAGAVIADGLHDDAFRSRHWPYAGELVVTAGALTSVVVGILAVRYVQTSQRVTAIAAAVVGGLGATSLGVFGVLAISDLSTSDEALTDSAVGSGPKILIGVSVVAIVLAAIALRSVGSTAPRLPAAAGGLAAAFQLGTALIVVAAVAVFDSTVPTARSTPVAGVARGSATAITTQPLATTPIDAATTAPPSTILPGPKIQESFAARIPDVDGYELTPAEDVLWPAYDLPGGAQAVAVNVSRNGAAIAQLVVAGRPEPNALFSTYSRRLFNEAVPIAVEGLTQLDSGSFRVSSNESLASWQAIGDAAVISATLPSRDAGQWTWQHGKLIWVVRGRLAAERFVAELLDQQRDEVGAYDQQGLDGRLLDRFPRLPGVVYYDAPRRDTLGVMDDAWSWPCADAFHLSYVPATDDPSPGLRDERSLTIEVSSVSQACEDAGFLDRLQTELAGRSELRLDTIAGREVFRSDLDVIHVDGDVVVHLSTTNAATMRDMTAVVERFIAAQPN